MSLRSIVLSTALMAGVALTGCTSYDAGNKEMVGTGLGALVGGLAGSQVGGGKGQLWATGAGVLLGALVGSELGRSLDKADMAYMNQAQSRAYSAPIGQTISWNNPQSGNSGTYTPIRDGRTNSGSYCREYQQTIYVGGQQETATGTACQQADGTWKIIN
ncbi:MAG: glycine zipper 2TM domain-containing protein [Alphaproteobacteria bacterium]|nr:glycine zipper 2TM domain-containing protein [Alphaproteobacteria bacterium]